MNRKEFIRSMLLIGGSIVTSLGAILHDRHKKNDWDSKGETTTRDLKTLDNIKPQFDEDVLIRMQRELKKAMKKPVEKRNWSMVIDIRKCVGCYACTVGCIAENKLPPGVVYRPVTTQESGQFPNVHLKFTPRPCMQCKKPSCVPVCPVNATWKRPDGVVVIDYDKCIGCRYCLTACPYGARTSDFGDYYHNDKVAQGCPQGDNRPIVGVPSPWENKTSNEYAKNWDRSGHSSPVGNARKCHFCLHRIQEGKLPICTSTCIGRATYFGDLNDSESLVSELIAKNNVQTLLPHKGTEPNVYYIV